MLRERVESFLTGVRNLLEGDIDTVGASERGYILRISAGLYDGLKEVAREENRSVGEFLREGMKLKLLKHAIERQGGSILVQKANGETVMLEPDLELPART